LLDSAKSLRCLHGSHRILDAKERCDGDSLAGTGPLSSVPHKAASALGEALPGPDGQRLQELLTRTRWQAAEMGRLRIQHMVAHTRAGSPIECRMPAPRPQAPGVLPPMQRTTLAALRRRVLEALFERIIREVQAAGAGP